MPNHIGYRCNNCGEDFILEVLTDEETEDARSQNEPLRGPACTKCGSANVTRVSS